MIADAGPYFDHLQDALLKARRSILIIGWDFDAAIKLRPEHDPRSLGELLRDCVEANPELEVRVLVWSVGVVHGPGDPLPLLFGAEWHNHPRIHVKLDTEHPFYAAHHQKIVVIDDVLAFAGGIDLTIERWDTAEHLTEHPARVCPDGKPYGPVHDLQMAVSGDAARAIGDLARHRWRSGAGETLEPPPPCEAIWPERLVPDFRGSEVAIARTAPTWGDHRGAREGAALAEDALASARSLIYIEAQYLTTASVGRILMRQLAAPTGPEIVVVVTRSSNSKLEHYVMGNNRDRLLRRLKKVDRHGRLHVYLSRQRSGARLPGDPRPFEAPARRRPLPAHRLLQPEQPLARPRHRMRPRDRGANGRGAGRHPRDLPSARGRASLRPL